VPVTQNTPRSRISQLILPDGDTNQPPAAVCMGTSEVPAEFVGAALTAVAAELKFALAAGVAEWPAGTALLGARFAEHAAIATVASTATPTSTFRQCPNPRTLASLYKVGTILGRDPSAEQGEASPHLSARSRAAPPSRAASAPEPVDRASACPARDLTYRPRSLMTDAMGLPAGAS
jgi:hypothetical protein